MQPTNARQIPFRVGPILLALLLRIPITEAGDVFTFDDITYWTGTGANRAACVIDWNGSHGPSDALVWGYRFSGSATGEAMLRAIVADDRRLFAKLSAGGVMGVALYGIGYDLNGDDFFGIDDGTTFSPGGIATSGPPDDPPPAAVAIDPNDLYAEGWFTGYWNYGVGSSGSPYLGGTWEPAPTGFSNRILHDGDWDSWAFTPTFDFNLFADIPQAAEPPWHPHADFQPDGVVDGFDLRIWQTGFGIGTGATLHDGDADSNGRVDGSDFLLWQRELGAGTEDGPAHGFFTEATVPEPASRVLALVVLLTFTFSAIQNQQNRLHRRKEYRS